METLFTSFGRALEGAPALACFAAFLWGVLSVVLSPCHLASLPLIVGYMERQGGVSPRRALVIASSFAFGILLSICVVGLVTAATGRMVGDVGGWVNYGVALIFFLFGLYLLDVISLPFDGLKMVPLKQRGWLGALVLGLVFGIALGPCTFAYMAPLLAVTFRLSSTDLGYSLLLILLYGLGHSAVIVAAGTFTGAVQRYLDWNEASKGADRLRKACGILVLLGGLYMLYRA